MIRLLLVVQMPNLATSGACPCLCAHSIASRWLWQVVICAVFDHVIFDVATFGTALRPSFDEHVIHAFFSVRLHSLPTEQSRDTVTVPRRPLRV